MAGWHGRAEPAPGCGTSSAGLHRVARAGPAELTGRRRSVAVFRHCSPFPVQPGRQRPAAGWATSIAAAMRLRHCRSPNALPPGMLRSWRSRPAPRVGPEMPHARCAGRPRSESALWRRESPQGAKSLLCLPRPRSRRAEHPVTQYREGLWLTSGCRADRRISRGSRSQRSSRSATDAPECERTVPIRRRLPLLEPCGGERADHAILRFLGHVM